MSHTPRPTSGTEDRTLAASSLVDTTPIDWDALMSRRPMKRKYGQRSSSCGSGRRSVDSFLSEDFGSGSRSPSPEDGPNAAPSADMKEIRGTPNNNYSDPDSPFWTRVFSDWDAKWKSVPKEDAPRQERDSNAPEPAPSASTSSSSSLSLPEEAPSSFSQKRGGRKKPKFFRKPFAKTVNGVIQRTLIKRKAKKWFTQFTAGLDDQGSNLNQAWRQRRVAGEELLRIAEREAHGDVIVARRFTKSLTRQAIGMRAILQLCEEEKDDPRLPPPLRHIGSESDLRYPKSRISHRLMVLIMLHTDRLLFLEKIVTGALKEGIDYGFRGVLFLATSIPDFFDHVDPPVISEYAAQAIKNQSLPSARWYQGIELLHHLFRHGSTTEHGKAAALSTGQLILNSAMKLCGDKSWDLNSLLRVVLRTCLVAKNKRILPFILPPALLSNIIQTVSSRSGIHFIDKASALVLKVHALCADQLKIGSIVSSKQVAWLVQVGMEVMYEPKYWQDLIEKELIGQQDSYDRSPLHLDEDAFSILCDLPEPAFQDGLKSLLWRRSRRSEAKTLDLLLWLSNMPANILKAHRALIGGEACRFLGAIITDTRSPGWQWRDRAEWRAKGEAMTCLGNIIERMDESELRDHVPKTVLDAVVALKENEEAPLTQRGQAIFMLQRYTVAADRCGVEPHHREDELPQKNEQEKEEGVQFGQ
ncbi:hypothetical protein FS837_011170 [Tulasnella sp. UAMH 9824]|nr:hypothetical protein FS837_011170 [Tulasnella sp. UAMH 9824]